MGNWGCARELVFHSSGSGLFTQHGNEIAKAPLCDGVAAIKLILHTTPITIGMIPIAG